MKNHLRIAFITFISLLFLAPLSHELTLADTSIIACATVPETYGTVLLNPSVGGTFLLNTADSDSADLSYPTGFYSSVVTLAASSQSSGSSCGGQTPPSGENFVGKIYTFNLSDLSNNGVSAINKAATIIAQYSSVDVSGLNENDIAPYRWNPNTSSWQLVGGGVVDTVNHQVIFSTMLTGLFALFAPNSNFIALPTTANHDGSLSATTTNTTAASVTSNGVAASVDIPAGTVITGPSSWDGTVMLPEATSTFTAPSPDPGYTASAVAAVAVGAGDTPLTFDSAVRLFFAGQTGKFVGWSRGGTFTPITTSCSADNQAAGDALPSDGDCKFDNGTDLIVWTKHFTDYVIYTQTAIPGSQGGQSQSGSPGGGGGGGAGAPPAASAPAPSQAGVTISGSAYPLSTVTVLQDAQIAVQSIAGPDGNFSMSVNDLSQGSYIFSVYAEDTSGNRSSLFTFPVSLTVGATTQISGVFLSPTIAVDKQEVKQGDTIAIFGQSVPNAKVTINIHSGQMLSANITSSESGAYLYDLDTSQLDMGSHAALAHTAKENMISNDSVSRSFTVGDRNIAAQSVSTAPLKGDFQGNGHVNLVDFSILAYYYGMPNPPAKYDLNGDGKVDLVDFSIMAFYWTG